MVRRYKIIAVLLLLLAGCVTPQYTHTPQIDTTSYEFTLALSTFIKDRYQTDLTVEDIMFEIELARYKEWVKTQED